MRNWFFIRYHLLVIISALFWPALGRPEYGTYPYPGPGSTPYTPPQPQMPFPNPAPVEPSQESTVSDSGGDAQNEADEADQPADVQSSGLSYELHLSFSAPGGGSVGYLYSAGDPTLAASWRTETVSYGNNPGPAGISPSLFMDRNWNPHITYFRGFAANHRIAHAYREAGQWRIEDTGGRDSLNAGFSTAAYLSSGDILMIKSGETYGLHSRRKQVRWPAPSVRDDLIQAGSMTLPFMNLSLAINSGDTIYAVGTRHRGFNEHSPMGPRYVRLYQSSIRGEATLGASCVSSDGGSVVVDSSDQFHVAYICNGVNSSTLFIGTNGNYVAVESISPVRPMIAHGTRELHAVYVDSLGRLLYRTRPLAGGDWSNAVVISAGEPIRSPQIATSDDVAHVVWIANGTPKYSQVNGGTSATTPVVIHGGMGSDTAFGWGFGVRGNQGASNFR